MTGPSDLGSLFEDLEQQAEGLALEDRDAELADRQEAEFARLSWVARVHGSIGSQVSLTLLGVGPVGGRLLRAGTDWMLVAPPERVIRLPAVRTASGLSSRSTVEQARPVIARLGFGAAVRGIRARGPLVLEMVDGSVLPGRVGRVGADFLESEGAVVPFSAVAAVRRC